MFFDYYLLMFKSFFAFDFIIHINIYHNMATKSTNMSIKDLLTDAPIMCENIKLNGTKIGRYGLDMPDFTNGMDSDILLLSHLNQEQERLKSLLTNKTEELNAVQVRLEQTYSVAKKTVKLAETQKNWLAYGIKDKK